MSLFLKKMCGDFSTTSTSPICMSFPKTTQEDRWRVLDGINRIDRVFGMENRRDRRCGF
jgi:hypothetical protein